MKCRQHYICVNLFLLESDKEGVRKQDMLVNVTRRIGMVTPGMWSLPICTLVQSK